MTHIKKRMIEFYKQGNLPWDQELPPPEVIDIMELLSPGRALDLGCGVGRAARYMAARGWQVDAVDFVPQAIKLAKANSAGFTSINYHLASVTELDFLTPAYQFALDVGCSHALNPTELSQYGDHLSRLMAPNGIFLLYGRLREDNAADNGPGGFVEETLFSVFEKNFLLSKVEYGQTHVLDMQWSSAWYWWQKR